MDLTLISYDEPTEVRTFHKGRFETYAVGPMTLGRATYEPGWKWSEHVGAPSGESMCQVEHVGLVLSGQAAVKMEDGTEKVMGAGEFFYVPPGPRQLGGRRRAVRLAPHHGQRGLRDVSSAVGEAFFQELLWVHGMIRQDLETVRELAARVAGGLAPGEVEAQVASLAANGPLWALKVNCLHYCRFVHGHHRLEDVALFPVLREADPDLAPLVDRLEGDHRRVAEQLDEVEAAVGALNGDEGERARVVEALNALAEDLLAHLEREEDGIGPAMRRMDRHPLSPRG